MSAFGKQADGAYKDSGNLIMEAVTNIRTVYSFGNEDIILNVLNNNIYRLIIKKYNNLKIQQQNKE